MPKQESFLKKIHTVFYKTIAINICICGLLNLFFYSKYTCSLDVMMRALLEGIAGEQSPNILFSNILIGKTLNKLIWLNDAVPWYTIMLYVFTFISLNVISYYILHKVAGRCGILIASVTVSFLGFECYITLSYMKTAALLCLAVAAICALLIEGVWSKKRIKRLAILVAAFFGLTSALLSFSVFLPVMILSFAGMVVAYAVQREKQFLLNFIRIVIPLLGVMIVCAVGSYKMDEQYYIKNDLNYSIEFRSDIERFYAYGNPGYTYQFEDILGVGREEYDSFTADQFYRRGEESLQLIHTFVLDNTEISFANLKTMMRGFPVRLLQKGIFYLVVVLAGFLLCTKEPRKKMPQILTAILLIFAGYFWMGFSSGWQQYWVAFLVIIPCIIPLLSHMDSVIEVDLRYAVATLVVLSVILYSNFSNTIPSSTNEKSISEVAMQDVEVGEPILDLNSLLKSYSAWTVYEKGALQGYQGHVINGSYGVYPEFEDLISIDPPTDEESYSWVTW